MLTLSQVVKVYGNGRHEHRALKGLDLHVKEGEFFTLLGPSGCGKTTALRCIAGLEIPTSGNIQINDEAIFSSSRGIHCPAEKRDVSMVFQSYAIWPHMTVAQNVAFPLDVQGVSRDEKKRRVEKALDLVGLTKMAARPATDLSGGQQQRVSLARAIIRGAKLLLLDEPLSNLDAELRVQMRRELTALQRMLGITTIFVTHDQEEAISMSDRVAVFNHGELVEIGKPMDLYLRPKHRFTATFLGLAELLACKVIAFDRNDETALVQTSFGTLQVCGSGVRAGEERKLLVRPEHVVLSPMTDTPAEPNCFEGVIESVVFAGRYIDYVVRIGEQALAVQAASLIFLGIGEAVMVTMSKDRCVLVDD